MSLRQHLLGWLLVAVLASTALTVGVGAVLVRQRVAHQVVATVERQAAAAASAGVRRRLVARPALRGRARALAAALPAGDVSGRRDGLAYARRGGVLVVRPAALRFADWRPFLASLLIAGAGAAGIAALVAAVMAPRLARPLAREFGAMADALEATRAADRAFLLSVSHELKTPLTAVRGYAEGLGDGALGAEEAAAVIGTEAARLERLVDDLLELGRLQRRAFAVRVQDVDLAAIAAAAVGRAADDRIALDAPDEAPARGDADRLLQVLANLIGNGLRAAGPHGTVTVTARPGLLAVSDTGPGLAPADVPRAFERFRSGARDGTGLGLAIVEELVRAMGGSVTVDRATFTVALQGAAAYAPASA